MGVRRFDDPRSSRQISAASLFYPGPRGHRFPSGVLIGILLSRKPKLSGIVLPILSVFNTIPGIVFIGLLVLVWGAQSATVLVALGCTPPSRC